LFLDQGRSRPVLNLKWRYEVDRRYKWKKELQQPSHNVKWNGIKDFKRKKTKSIFLKTGPANSVRNQNGNFLPTDKRLWLDGFAQYSVEKSTMKTFQSGNTNGKVYENCMTIKLIWRAPKSVKANAMNGISRRSIN